MTLLEGTKVMDPSSPPGRCWKGEAEWPISWPTKGHGDECRLAAKLAVFHSRSGGGADGLVRRISGRSRTGGGVTVAFYGCEPRKTTVTFSSDPRGSSLEAENMV